MTSKKTQIKLPLWVMGVVLAVSLPGRATEWHSTGFYFDYDNVPGVSSPGFSSGSDGSLGSFAPWDGVSVGTGTVEVIHTTLAQLSSPAGFFTALPEPSAGIDAEPILDIVIAGARWSKQGNIFLTDPVGTDPHCHSHGTPPCFSDRIEFVNDASGTANLWFASDQADGIKAMPGVVHPAFNLKLGEDTIGPNGLSFNGTFTSGRAFKANLFSDVVSVGGTNSDSVSLISRTPEPATLTLLGSGLLGLAGWIRRRVRK